MADTTTLGRLAQDYRDLLVAGINAADLDTVEALVVYGDGRNPWPWLGIYGSSWRSYANVIPTSGGMVLEVGPGTLEATRVLTTHGRTAGAVLLELLALAAPPCAH